MKLICAVCAFYAVLTSASWARIGESLEQCIMRYGPVVENRKAELPQSDPGAAVFSKNGLTVVVEFRNDSAWRIVFRKPKLTVNEVEALLSANSSSSEAWGQPLRYGDREYRRSADKSRISITRFAPNNEITQTEILLREYSDQLRANVLTGPIQSGASEEEKPKVNPLPGF